jgi:hypothetical protein
MDKFGTYVHSIEDEIGIQSMYLGTYVPTYICSCIQSKNASRPSVNITYPSKSITKNIYLVLEKCGKIGRIFEI